MKIFENSVMSIFYYEQAKSPFLELVWTKKTEDLNDSEYRKMVETYLEKVLTHKTKQVLIDTSMFFYTIPVDTQTWINENIFPKTIEAGLKKMAIILSKDFYGQLSVELTMSENPDLGFVVHYFEDRESAVNWLE